MMTLGRDQRLRKAVVILAGHSPFALIGFVPIRRSLAAISIRRHSKN